MSRYPLLPEEGKEALKEHALGNYLPLTGGLYQNYGIRNFGIKKKPKKGVKFYAVEYRPHRIWLHKSPIYFDSEKRLKEFYRNIRDNSQNNFYKWGTERGFEFSGYKTMKDTEEMKKIKAKKITKKAWYELHRLTEIEFKKDPSLNQTLPYDYPTQSFFKIGLTSETAKKRGYAFFDKEDKKKYPNPYKTIFIEKDLTYLSKKVHPADIEGFIYFYLFYKYWKDKLFYFSPSKINLMPEPRHQKIQFNGYSESFLFENVEDKLKIINEAFELLESLTKFKISWKIRYMINFSNAWQLAGLQKKGFFWYSSDHINFDNWWFSNDSNVLKNNNKFKDGHDFFEKIGFWDKWIPDDVNQLKDLFDKKAEEFTLPNVKHYPEISNLKKFEYK